jgi:hypothetical protein
MVPRNVCPSSIIAVFDMLKDRSSSLFIMIGMDSKSHRVFIILSIFRPEIASVDPELV